MSDNPYAAPKTDVAPLTSTEGLRFERIAKGQRFIIIAILLYFAAFAARYVLLPPESLFVALSLLLCSCVLAIIGLIGLSRGLGYGNVVTILILLAMLIPVVGLIVLVVCNQKATKILRANGYKVGFFGAEKQRA